MMTLFQFWLITIIPKIYSENNYKNVTTWERYNLQRSVSTTSSFKTSITKRSSLLKSMCWELEMATAQNVESVRITMYGWTSCIFQSMLTVMYIKILGDVRWNMWTWTCDREYFLKTFHQDSGLLWKYNVYYRQSNVIKHLCYKFIYTLKTLK